MARASSNLFLRLVVAEGAATLLNEMIIVKNPRETVESIILPHLQKLGKSKHLIEMITVEPSSTDINDVCDQMVIEDLEVFWGGQYPNLNVKLKKTRFGIERRNAFSVLMERAADNTRMKDTYGKDFAYMRNLEKVWMCQLLSWRNVFHA